MDAFDLGCDIAVTPQQRMDMLLVEWKTWTWPFSREILVILLEVLTVCFPIYLILNRRGCSHRCPCKVWAHWWGKNLGRKAVGNCVTQYDILGDSQGPLCSTSWLKKHAIFVHFEQQGASNQTQFPVILIGYTPEIRHLRRIPQTSPDHGSRVRILFDFYVVCWNPSGSWMVNKCIKCLVEVKN